MLTKEQLDEARKAVNSGSTIKEQADKLGVNASNLGRQLSKVKQKREDIKPIEIPLVNQLEGKIGLLQDANKLLKAQLKESQKMSVAFSMLKDELDMLVQPIPPGVEMWKKRSKGTTKESLVLHLSDGHHDSVILPHTVGGLERHDFNIALARGEVLVDTLLDFTQNNMSGYEFHTLWILANGDHTGGEIHNSVENSHFGNMMKNCLAIGQFHSQMYRDLASWFPSVKVVYLSGNHGRRKEVKKKDYHNAQDSWDYLIAETARSYCRDLINVEFLIPDSFSIVVEIEGFNFHVEHGDGIKSWNSIPFYGIERKTRRLTALSTVSGEFCQFHCFGHFHQASMMSTLKGETLMNGSWLATDPFVYNALSGYNEPAQLLHGVHENRGVTWRMPIQLKRSVEEPKRYKVSIDP